MRTPHFEEWYNDPNGMFKPGFCTRHDEPLITRPYYHDCRRDTGPEEVFCWSCEAERTLPDDRDKPLNGLRRWLSSII